MNFQFPISNCECRRARGNAARRRNSIGNRQSAIGNGFTLIELLVVLAIIGLLAAVGLPALKGFGASNAIVTADRQLLDDMQFARQRALAEHTGVFVIFASPYLTTKAISTYTPQQQVQVSNVLSRQYSAYAMLSRRSVGDQPGVHQTNYLTSWRSLPEGIFIWPRKFIRPDSTIVGPSSTTPTAIANFSINGFNTNSFPFPTASDANFPQPLPYVAFNYLGQLSLDGVNPSGVDEYIPLTRGSIFYDANFNADIAENPKGNSTNLYNIIHIDALTGRARVEQQQIK